jgi:hypothetical protein
MWRLRGFAYGFTWSATIVAILFLDQDRVAAFHPVLSCVTLLFLPWEETLRGLGESASARFVAGLASVATWGLVCGFIGMMWRHPGRTIGRICGGATAGMRWPEWTIVLCVGIALAYVNLAAPIWFRSSTLSWSAGDIEIDGRHDSSGHLGWPMTYYVVTGGGLEQRPSWMWMYAPLGSRGMGAYLGIAHLVGDVVWACVMLVATRQIATRVLNTVRRRRISLGGVFVAVTVAALVVFLEAKCRDGWREWHDYDGAGPYLTSSALYQWFGPRSSYEWLYRYGLVVRLPILLAWLCLVWQACSYALVCARKWKVRT